jgi:hypothetical protein
MFAETNAGCLHKSWSVVPGRLLFDFAQPRLWLCCPLFKSCLPAVCDRVDLKAGHDCPNVVSLHVAFHQQRSDTECW